MSEAAAATSVLVVEDEGDLRALNEIVLKGAGYAVSSVCDGAAAVEALRSHTPDVMVLDLSMPRLDGFGVLSAMAALGARTRTVVVTARHAPQDVERAIALGASDYLAKPFQPEQLLARVARLSRRRGR